MKLIAISLATIMILLIAGLYARNYGLTQEYSGFSHPLMGAEEKPLIIIDTELKTTHLIEKANSKLWIQHWLIEKKAPAIEIDVYMTAQGELIYSNQLDELSKKGQKIENFETTADIEVEFHSVSKLLKSYPDSIFLLDIRSNTFGAHHFIDRFLSEHPQSKDRIILRSDYSVITETTRKLAPKHLFASGVPELVRLTTLNSLWLEPLASLDADLIYLKDLDVHSENSLRRMLSEIARRRKSPLLDFSKQGDLKSLNKVRMLWRELSQQPVFVLQPGV